MDEYTVHIITEYPFGALPANLAHDTGGMISPAAIEDEENGDTNIATNLLGLGRLHLIAGIKGMKSF
ncbi:hypothetical protein [Geomicrobium sp. JCM 19037]|uniref:hypothetical protein n=1 Tax=Geomicrobium sp. JCM 19037 TaxID=1460634 RepID=UPI00187C3BD2|nr:hypothetical protein [Geomicrobium sp. JCM 19037]